MKLNKLVFAIGLSALMVAPSYAHNENIVNNTQIIKNIPSIEFEKPQIFQVREGAKATGSKMTIHNGSDKDLIITNFKCEGFGETMLHDSKFVNGERKMFMIKKIVISAHTKKVISPNTMHFMMFQPERKFKIGEYLKMTLETNLGTIPVIAEIVPRRLK
ncbi:MULTISPECIES: copper chaperone PCu(A)C [Pasteurellaceae]|uniref:Copper chaperone PCu(A)C n=1 Tax=Pasteurella atlantica TaxID=2827233 RepID=A0AAW8CEK4_9PAST|nr:copper chaperone PCu(A)C [Pasteurella atlantica]MBR0572644.1 copper chaperone PCu(A)C [Pasteurella atlantica]MDP8038590.1 copper chaperone PCu(A)C [Pasteurella atlantica]MDP8040682.1 copper chaperone PCu(A)C [Pasteurella atlantica]MDP8042817.1 copper chaperone PCu(A)C [Pasteurella atlantica]MDP8044904.1 copper chaperone PCu(A)C [Pasteurella atlantica]